MGHKASDWADQVAVVRVQVLTRGNDAAVRLFRTDSGKVFANAPIRVGGPPAVEQVTDSSRYFALRIEDGKGASVLNAVEPHDWIQTWSPSFHASSAPALPPTHPPPCPPQATTHS
jgi:hypothetical protein